MGDEIYFLGFLTWPFSDTIEGCTVAFLTVFFFFGGLFGVLSPISNISSLIESILSFPIIINPNFYIFFLRDRYIAFRRYDDIFSPDDDLPNS